MLISALNFIGKYGSPEKGSVARSLLKTTLRDILRYRRKIIHKQIEKCFGNQNTKAIINGYYDTLAKLILETTASFYWDQSKMLKMVTMDPASKALLNAHKEERMIILCSHVGNWELTIPTLPFFTERSVYGVYKPMSNKAINERMLSQRGKFGLILKPMEQIARAFYKEENGAFIFINDQSPAKNSKGQWIPFFKQDTLWYDGVKKLSKSKKVVFLYLSVEPMDSGYKTSLCYLDQKDPLTDYVKKLENDIINYPHHWLWSHNRWKSKKS